MLVDLEHRLDRALEELAVVRDNDGAPCSLANPTFESRQTIEVEVVGRLVEQDDVKA